MQNYSMATFGLSILRGAPGADNGILSANKTPLNNCMSSKVPPSFWYIFMSFRSMLVAVLMSHMLLIELRAIGASSVAFWETIFELREVLTHCKSCSSSDKSTLIPSSEITSNDLLRASANPSDILVGWIPYSRRLCAASKRAPDSMTTDVVPSPASISYALEVWISNLAAGWKTYRFLRIVAPSLVTISSPFWVSISLSMPFGPREVFMRSAMAIAALMFYIHVSSVFWDLFWISPSFLGCCELSVIYNII